MCRIRFVLLAAALSTGLYASAEAATGDTALQAVIKGPQRSPEFVKRDASRHPLEELEFFGIKPTDTVVEIWPSPGYWTEILAPYLNAKGTYYTAVNPPVDKGPEGGMVAKFKEKLDEDPKTYGKVMVTIFDKGQYDIAPAGTADLIVTFRNLHNWMHGDYADAALSAFFKALKPGGVLGIEDHRSKTDKPQDPQAKNGYVRQDYAIDLAKKAGFVFVGSSEINANPKDTTDWPKGVWTLPPTFAMGDVDHDKYAAIGEADNFVLKFKKPAK